jgi:hypothetical protein
VAGCDKGVVEGDLVDAALRAVGAIGLGICD